MKNIFKYIGILTLTCFSFYYTKEVATLFKNEDFVMKQIDEYSIIHDKLCDEGYITEDGVVLGITGLVVDKDLSYSYMKGIGFNQDLIKYKESPCVVSKNNNKEYYIIRGNEKKNSVSLLININNGKLLNDIVNISNYKEVQLSFIIDYNFLSNNLDLIKELINSNYDILYKGSNEISLKKFLKEIKSINKNYNTFCVSFNEYDPLEYCYKNRINSIKPNKYYKNKFLSNIKNNISKGDIIILEETSTLKDELGVIINYIKSRGLNEVNISTHLN